MSPIRLTCLTPEHSPCKSYGLATWEYPHGGCTITQPEPLGEIHPDRRLGGLPMSLAWTSRVAWTDPRYPRGGLRPGLRPRGGVTHLHVTGTRSIVRTRGGALLRLAAEGEAPRLQTVDLAQDVHEGRGLRSAGDRKLARRGRLVRHRLDEARTAVVNLVRNATANSGMEEPVVGSVARRRYSATIMLHDRDPGPGPSDRDRIFDPFVPGTNFPGTPSGSGLGLYLTRRIVPGHAGSAPAGTSDGRSALPLGMNGRQPSAS
jgi:anti-sigma regulatory factor (Ser/Thr protein kinase)